MERDPETRGATCRDADVLWASDTLKVTVSGARLLPVLQEPRQGVDLDLEVFD
jgi:hypothetical protein